MYYSYSSTCFKDKNSLPNKAIRCVFGGLPCIVTSINRNNRFVNRKIEKFEVFFLEVANLIERVESLMKERGVTGVQLSIEMGLSKNAISEWKNGKIKLSADTIVKLANYFCVSTDYLLTGTETSREKGRLTKKEKVALSDYENANLTGEYVTKEELQAIAEKISADISQMESNIIAKLHEIISKEPEKPDAQ